MSICFIIDAEAERQIFGIKDEDPDQVRWLDILSEHIPNSHVEGVRPPIDAGGIHYGIFTFHEFKNFIKELGYPEAVARTDTLYLHQVV